MKLTDLLFITRGLLSQYLIVNGWARMYFPAIDIIKWIINATTGITLREYIDQTTIKTSVEYWSIHFFSIWTIRVVYYLHLFAREKRNERKISKSFPSTTSQQQRCLIKLLWETYIETLEFGVGRNPPDHSGFTTFGDRNRRYAFSKKNKKNNMRETIFVLLLSFTLPYGGP